MKQKGIISFIPILMVLLLLGSSCYSQQPDQSEVDRKVRAFLESNRRWYDMNVPTRDGQLLHDLIVENNYTQALEIGTSTGHSGIWIAWALSKTGGKLITVEIDERRHREALENFKEAGVDHIIDARLADAHELVPALDGPFDFVFSDADKDWYQNYFQAVDPKMKVGGCYTTHNISEYGRRGGGSSGYLPFLRSLDNYETTLQGSSVAVSYKRAEQ